MTERPTDPAGLPADSFDHEVIEVASALVDGVATPVEQERFGSNPQVSAVSTTFGSLRGHLAHPEPAPAAQREAHLAAALDAFSALSQPVSLDAARARRARRLMPALAAAAALAVVGVVIGSMAGRSGSREQAAVERTVTSDVSTARTRPKEQAGANEVSSSDLANASTDTRPMAAAVAASGDAVVATDTPSTEPTGEGGDAVGQPTYAASTPRQLLGIAKEVADRQVAGAGARLTNPCPNIAGEVGAELLWINQPALLLLSPNAQRPTDAVVVNPSTCAVEATVTLGA